MAVVLLFFFVCCGCWEERDSRSGDGSRWYVCRESQSWEEVSKYKQRARGDSGAGRERTTIYLSRQKTKGGPRLVDTRKTA